RPDRRGARRLVTGPGRSGVRGASLAGRRPGGLLRASEPFRGDRTARVPWLPPVVRASRDRVDPLLLVPVPRGRCPPDAGRSCADVGSAHGPGAGIPGPGRGGHRTVVGAGRHRRLAGGGSAAL
ncbi:uncharacterized protein METZ01_LOCUS118028, partial [marine metagenome]